MLPLTESSFTGHRGLVETAPVTEVGLGWNLVGVFLLVLFFLHCFFK